MADVTVDDGQMDANESVDASAPTEAQATEAQATDRAEHAEHVPTDLPDGADPIFEALWKRAIDAWEDDKVHAALLEHALRVQMLPDLAGRYRALENDEAKGPRAKKKLDALVAAATQMLFATKSPERQGVPRSITLTVFGICALGVALVAYAFFHGR